MGVSEAEVFAVRHLAGPSTLSLVRAWAAAFPNASTTGYDWDSHPITGGGIKRGSRPEEVFPMASDRLTRKALEVGRKEAQEVLKLRATALKRRSAATRRPRAAKRGVSAEGVDEALVRAVGGPATAGVLVAEGDSWFDYPLHDVLSLLEDKHAYDVESVAQKGDRVEEMAYGRGQLEELTRRLEKLLRRGVLPKAILLSGGGNDVAGDEFGMLLNHARSAISGLNAQVVAGVIDQRVRFAYITILSAITEVCEKRIGRRLPVLVHGYDYPVPDGRGFLGGWWLLPGPWLEPGFREKGFEKLQERIRSPSS